MLHGAPPEHCTEPDTFAGGAGRTPTLLVTPADAVGDAGGEGCGTAAAAAAAGCSRSGSGGA